MEHNERLTSFARSFSNMANKNISIWDDYLNYERSSGYTTEEVDSIIGGNNTLNKINLSRHFFARDGIYKRTLMYLATLLNYSKILIPNPSFGKNLSAPHIQKKYMQAIEYDDKILTPELLTRWSLKTLVDGSYYGLVFYKDKNEPLFIDLPVCYCRSQAKDIYGRDIVEINISYFDTLTEIDRKNLLSIYPKEVLKELRKRSNHKSYNEWISLPTDVAFHFSFEENNAPILLEIIPASMQYDLTVDIEQERNLDEIRKIIVQTIPHLNDGTLLMDPPEAQSMHEGAVDMLKKNKFLSVLTTYADVEAITSKSNSSDKISNNLSKMLQNIYSEAGISSEIFAPTGSHAVDASINVDLSMMMILANKYANFLTNLINTVFGNSNINFKLMILPVTLHNRSDFITDSLKLAQAGYSFLLPSIGMGIGQRSLLNIKNLENDVLKLNEKLIPLSSSFTQTPGQKEEGKGATDEGGAPPKKDEDKSARTLDNEDSLDKQGGSKG